MTIFDTIRYPVTDFNSACNLFNSLPIKIQKQFDQEYDNRCNNTGYPSSDYQVNLLKRLIFEYDEFI